MSSFTRKVLGIALVSLLIFSEASPGKNRPARGGWRNPSLSQIKESLSAMMPTTERGVAALSITAGVIIIAGAALVRHQFNAAHDANVAAVNEMCGQLYLNSTGGGCFCPTSPSLDDAMRSGESLKPFCRRLATLVPDFASECQGNDYSILGCVWGWLSNLNEWWDLMVLSNFEDCPYWRGRTPTVVDWGQALCSHVSGHAQGALSRFIACMDTQKAAEAVRSVADAGLNVTELLTPECFTEYCQAVWAAYQELL